MKLGLDYAMIERAKCFAAGAHCGTGQIRRDTGEPYIVHPQKVAKLVEENGGSADAICAAWLHDVIEDTKVTAEDLLMLFPQRVVTFVMFLTDNKRVTDRPIRYMGAPVEARLVKLCDIIANAEDFLVNSNHGWKFAKEKRKLIPILELDETPVTLVNHAKALLDELSRREGMYD